MRMRCRRERVLAIEVKLSATVTDADTRNRRSLAGQSDEDLLDVVVINTGRPPQTPPSVARSNSPI
jgi:hypothetical protein